MKSTTASVDKVKETRLITALKTPYLPNGKVDLAAYDALVEKQIEGWRRRSYRGRDHRRGAAHELGRAHHAHRAHRQAVRR